MFSFLFLCILTVGCALLDWAESDSLKTPPTSDGEEEQPPCAPVTALRPSTSSSVREWDVGKQLVGKFVEPADKDPDAFARRNLLGGPMELTQEDWVARQRKERNSDFAPPSSYDKSFHNRSHRDDDRGHARENSSRSDKDEQEDRQQRDNNRKIKETVMSQNIVNECTGSSADYYKVQPGKSYETSSVFIDYKNASKGVGAEIPPPALCEYYCYGSSSKNKSRTPLFEPKAKMEDAIVQGLKRFRDAT